MRPHSGSEQVPVRRRGFQPAGAQRRPPALPVQPLQRDEEADRGGRAAVLARDVQGGWAAPLAASVATPPPPTPGCGVRWENGAGAGGEAARPSPCQSGGLHGRAVLAKAFNRVRSGTSTSSPPRPLARPRPPRWFLRARPSLRSARARPASLRHRALGCRCGACSSPGPWARAWPHAV